MLQPPHDPDQGESPLLAVSVRLLLTRRQCSALLRTIGVLLVGVAVALISQALAGP